MSPTSSPPQRQLPPDLQLHILSLLPPNEVGLSGRLVSPDAAAGLSGPEHCSASLSQPLPPHAVLWAMEAGQQHVWQLPFRHKLQLLCTAAASGSEVNLEVALAVLQPSIFPEVLEGMSNCKRVHLEFAAVEAGHPQLLAWLWRRCPGLLSAYMSLAAAARYCDKEGMQTVWELCKRYDAGSSNDRNGSTLISQWMLDWAAGSATQDAVAKMQWVLAAASPRWCRLDFSTTAAAVRSGDLGRLRWLRDRGCPIDGEYRYALQCALEHADLAVAQWLVDEAGCALPQTGTAGSAWTDLFLAAASSADCVVKWHWLRDRGALPLSSSPQLLRSLAGAVIQCGRVEGLQGLVQLFPHMETAEGQNVLQQALNEAEGPRCIAMARQLQQEGYVLASAAYLGAAWAGDLGMVRFLAREAGVPIGPMGFQELIKRWPRDTAAHRRGLLQAVQLVVGGAGHGEVVTKGAACAAAHVGNLPVVRYLLQQMPGYQPDAVLLRAAVGNGCEALLEWLVEQPGCRAALEQNSFHMYQAALGDGDRGTLTALRRLGVPWGKDDVVVWAVQGRCELPVLRWLLEQGAPVGRARDLARVQADVVWSEGLSAADAKVMLRQWLRWCVAAATALHWWAWLRWGLLGWW